MDYVKFVKNVFLYYYYYYYFVYLICVLFLSFFNNPASEEWMFVRILKCDSGLTTDVTVKMYSTETHDSQGWTSMHPFTLSKDNKTITDQVYQIRILGFFFLRIISWV